VNIFHEILDDQIYLDILLSDSDMVLLQEGSLIFRNTVIALNEDDLFNKTLCVGIVAPQAQQVYHDIWDQELDEEEERE
jgi:hypothetical protein